MTKVLITGANGFVGRQIIRALDVDGICLIPVVRDGKKHTVSGFQRVERVVTSNDVFSEKESWWEQQCHGVDIVIHAAWYAEPGEYQHSSINMDCLIGSLNLAKGAVKAGVKRFLGIGTCAEYDQSKGILTITTPLKPLTTYASAKASLFLALSEWLPNRDVSFAWARLFYLYGEGEDQRRLVSYVRTQLAKGKIAKLTSGKQIRDFMDVTDAGKKIAELALVDRTGPFNVCSGIPITVRELAEQIGEELEHRELLKFGARADNPFDPPCVIGVPNV